VAGFAIIIVCQTLEIFIFPDIFNDVPLNIYITVGILPMIGLFLGYLSGSALCLKPHIKKTISVEIGVKNVGTAITIVMLSFPFEVNMIKVTVESLNLNTSHIRLNICDLEEEIAID
jgi:predicted Na+-dependent transporter